MIEEPASPKARQVFVAPALYFLFLCSAFAFVTYRAMQAAQDWQEDLILVAMLCFACAGLFRAWFPLRGDTDR